MKKMMLAAALVVFATYPAMAEMNDSDLETSSGTTAEEMDTTLTQEPGVLEEQNRDETLDSTVDSTSGATMNDHSQNVESNEQYYFPNGIGAEDVQSGATAEAPVNESVATTPRGIDNRGAWNLSAGPALTLGLDSDSVLYGVAGGYTFNLTPALGARVFADANFGTGEDASQYLDVGVAAKLGMGDVIGQQTSRAYLLGDVALANAQNAETDNSESGVSVGAGVGYNFLRTQRTDIDLLLRYSLMLSEVDGDLPSLLTARVGVNF